MRTEWENSKSHLEATLNSAQENFQVQQQFQQRSTQLLDEERARSQELKGIIECYQLQIDEKQRELDETLHLHSAEIRLNEELLLKQQQLEREKEQLQMDQDTISQRYDSLCSKLLSIETQQQIQQKKYEEDMQNFNQLKQSLQESQVTLIRREDEYENKLKIANNAKLALERAQNEVNAKAELLAKQLEIFQQHGLPPKERIFQQMMGDLKHMFKKHHPQSPKCFISYAWEDSSTPSGKEANLLMQQWIGRLTNDLRKIGMQVFFDLDNMQGNLKATMMNNISQSDHFIIICTPR
jgi:hypothetical protein